MTAFLKQLAVLPAIETMSPQEARAFGKAFGEATPPGPSIARVENSSIPSPTQSLPSRIYHGVETVAALLVYFHGGGWTLGNLDSCDALLRSLAQQCRLCIVSVDYRLAPEHPFPAAVEDAYASLLWASHANEDLAGRRVPLFVGGDSAGGNLAAAAAILARDAASLRLDGQVLFYPVIDADFDRPSYVANAEGYFLTGRMMKWFWDNYVPDQARRQDFRASPIRASSLAGLPPTLIQTAELDPLRDEGEAYAAALSKAGVDVTLQRRLSMIHGYVGMTSLLTDAALAVADSAAWLNRAIEAAGLLQL